MTSDCKCTGSQSLQVCVRSHWARPWLDWPRWWSRWSRRRSMRVEALPVVVIFHRCPYIVRWFVPGAASPLKFNIWINKDTVESLSLSTYIFRQIKYSYRQHNLSLKNFISSFSLSLSLFLSRFLFSPLHLSFSFLKLYFFLSFYPSLSWSLFLFKKKVFLSFRSLFLFLFSLSLFTYLSPLPFFILPLSSH